MNKETLIHVRGAVIVITMIGTAIALPAGNSVLGILQLLSGVSLILGALLTNMYVNPNESPLISKELRK